MIYSIVLMLLIFPGLKEPKQHAVDTLPENTDYQKAFHLKRAAQYDSAFYYFDKAEAGFRAAANWGGIVRCRYGIGGIYTDMGNYRKAEEVLLNALQTGYAHLDTLHIAIADAHTILAYNYSQMPKLREAEKHYLAGLAILVRILGEESVPAANAYAGLGAVYFLMKDANHKAIEALTKSIEIFEKTGNEKSIEIAKSYNDLANIYDQEEQLDKAIAFHQKSLAIKHEVLREKHPEIGVSYYNLAQAYLDKGDLEKAITFYKKTLSIDITTFGEEHRWVAEDYSNISQCYHIKGSYELAMQYARKAADILHTAYGEHDFRVARSYNTIGVNHYAMEQYEQAISIYQKALNILGQLPEKNISKDIGDVTALGNNRIGMSFTRLGNYSAAVQHHQKALAIYTNLFHENHSDVGRTYMHTGDSYAYAQQYDRALSYYQQALSVLQQSLGDNHPEVAECLGKIGETYLNEKLYTQALSYYQRALKGFDADYKVTDIYKHAAIPNATLTPVVLSIINGKARALKGKYQITQDLGDLEFSFQSSQFAANMLDSMRISFLETGTRQNLAATHMNIYETGIATAYALYQVTHQQQYLADAFALAERSKSFLLLAALQDSEAKQFVGIPDTVLQKEKDLKVTRAFYEKKTHESEGTEKENYWRNQAFDVNLSYDSLLRALAKNYPRYHQLKYNTAALPLTTLQTKVLNKNEVLLEYFWGEENIFMFVISKQRAHLFKLANARELSQKIDTVRNILVQRKEEPGNFSEHAYQLYQWLVSPADSLIQDKDLLIIPDGALSYLPFEVLPNHQPMATSSFFGLPYMIKSHNIHYTFSATILAQYASTPRKSAEIRYLAFAPEFNNQNDDLLQNSTYPAVFSTSDTVRGGLVPLKGAAREIATISQMMEGDLYEGETAHEAAFKQYAENYDILHLATHAIVDDRHPLNSRMLFTVTDDTTEDGSLYVWELYNMQIKARMAVLSACNTGFGKLQRGEGVMSLGRAFAYAGCPSVIMSLWPAQDQATADLMNFFYQALHEGMPKNEALRQAKLQYLATTDELFAHPFYWAGFVAQGNPEPINPGSSFPVPWLLGSIIALFVLFLFFWLKKR